MFPVGTAHAELPREVVEKKRSWERGKFWAACARLEIVRVEIHPHRQPHNLLPAASVETINNHFQVVA